MSFVISSSRNVTRGYHISKRYFARAIIRSPKQVLTEDEARNHGYESPFKNRHQLVGTKPREVKDLDPARPVNLGQKLNEKKIQSAKYPDIPRYEKMEDDDKRFTSIMMQVKSRKQRSKINKILLEGRRLIKDAIDAGMSIETIYFSREDTIAGLGLDKLKDAQLYRVLYKTMSVWSDLTTSPGVMAICKKPDVSKLFLTGDKRLPVTVVCDNIREPGNLGSVLRCMAAAGCERAIATKGCVDVWDPKVLRGGAGAHFRFPIYSNIDWPYIKNYLKEPFQVVLADNHETKPESTTRQKENQRDADSDDEIDFLEKQEDGLIKESAFENLAKLEKFKSIPLTAYKYDNVKFNHDAHTVLIIGGETEGLSACAYKLAHDFDGINVTIPLANNVESLSVSSAVAILLFEIRRQLEQL